MDNTEIFWLSFREEETKEGKSVLVLTRKVGEGIAIGDDVKIVIMQIKGKQVRIGIQADPSTAVHREEIYQKIKEENRSASSSALFDEGKASSIFSSLNSTSSTDGKRAPMRRPLKISKDTD